MTGALEQAKAVGDAVLYEGYLLYPYRASAAKNRTRWQFGVLMPPSFAASGSGEHADSRTECLLEPGSHAVLHIRLRFLHSQRRVVQAVGPDGGFHEVDSLVVGSTEHTTWDEAVEREVDAVLRFADLLAQDNEVPFTVPGDERIESLGHQGRVVRRTLPLRGLLRVRAESLSGPFGGSRLRVDVANTTEWQPGPVSREDALRRALIAAHLVLTVDSGRFLSLVDPPEWAAPAAAACVNERSWPVLIGRPGDERAMLAAPIILYDYPTIAPESPGALFDGTEIDEILTLRTMTLTDEEKRQARATDPRTRDLLDRVDSLPPELLERLHGTIRYLRSVTGEPEPTTRPDVPWWDPGADASVSPATDVVHVAGVPISAGHKVRLRPVLRRADAQDMFFDGRIATVQAVLSDVDGVVHLAVTVDDDPAAEFQGPHGRFRYFSPDEVEPLEES